MEFISFDTSEFYSDGIWTWDNSEKGWDFEVCDQFRGGISSSLFKAGKSSAFKMADCPFYSQAQLAYKEGPLLKERGCEVEKSLS